MKLTLALVSLIWSFQLMASTSAFVLPGGTKTLSTTVQSPSDGMRSSRFLASSSSENNIEKSPVTGIPSRRAFVASLVIPTVGGFLGGVAGPSRANAEEGGDESFASIAERTNKMSKNVGSASAHHPVDERPIKRPTILIFPSKATRFRLEI
jgi:hypothetical protein